MPSLYWHGLKPYVEFKTAAWPWEDDVDKKVVVPEGMLKAGCEGALKKGLPLYSTDIEFILQYALRWLSENPIVPTDGDLWNIHKLETDEDWLTSRKFVAVEWQLRMFLAPEPDPRRQKIIDVLKQYPDRAPEIADKILGALEE